MKISSSLLILTFISLSVFSQPIAVSRQEAYTRGIDVKTLDSLYQSAVHIDSTQAVFKPAKLQEKMYQEYVKLLESLGDYLETHKFVWTKPIACFNRIYFDMNGAIDYYIYSFRGKPEDMLSPEQELEFNRLLNEFIQEYKVDLKADRPFAQCSPSTFMPR